MSEYYNLLLDSMKNGRENHIIYLFSRLSSVTDGSYLNVCTGNTIKYCEANSYGISIKRPIPYKTNIGAIDHFIDDSFKVFGKGLYSIAYENKRFGFVSFDEIRRLVNKYDEWLFNYDHYSDKERLKAAIEEEIDYAFELSRKEKEIKNLKNSSSDEELKVNEDEEDEYESDFINDENEDDDDNNDNEDEEEGNLEKEMLYEDNNNNNSEKKKKKILILESDGENENKIKQENIEINKKKETSNFTYLTRSKRKNISKTNKQEKNISTVNKLKKNLIKKKIVRKKEVLD